jgi:hypothetical protein
MQNTEDQDKKDLADFLKKQFTIFGPVIAQMEVRKVNKLEMDTQGELKSFQGDPKQILQLLINQFHQLSPHLIENKVSIASVPTVPSGSNSSLHTLTNQEVRNPSSLPVNHTPSNTPVDIAEQQIHELKVVLQEMNK